MDSLDHDIENLRLVESNDGQCRPLEAQKDDSSAFNFVHVLPAVLEMISYYLDGYDIMALYRTNSHALMMRMKMSVREIRIKRMALNPSWNTSFWSVLSICSHLKTVSLLDPTLSIWKHGPKLIYQLPKSVEKIFFHIPFLFGDYLLIDSSRTYASFAQKQKYLLSGSNHRYMGQVPLWDLKKNFPNLSLFSVSHAPSRSRLVKSYDSKSRRKAIQSFFSSCPESLTEVSLPESFDGAMALPQSISSLQLRLSDEESILDICNNVSPHMLSLELHTTRKEGIFDFSSIPPSLERLVIENMSPYEDGMTLKGFKDLSLASLSIILQSRQSSTGKPKQDLFDDLPPTLTDLKCEIKRTMHYDFAKLPQCLTSLELTSDSIELFGSRCLSFPPRMTRLIINSFHFSANDIFRMPRTLTFLEFSYRPIFRLPLIMSDPDPSQFVAALNDPRQLDSEGDYKWHDLASIFLPSNLVHLRILRSNFGHLWFKNLPSNLRILTMCTNNNLAGEILDSLPDTLVELNLLATGGMDDKTIEDLPESLERLTIECRLNKVTGAIFRKLPRSLLFLSINFNNNFQDQHIGDLPRLLTHFIAPESENLSSNCAPKLPRCLTSLILKRFILANPRPPKHQILDQMPPFVRTYDLKWSNPKGSSINFESISN